MTMSPEPRITLYDIPSTATPQAWSPNTWKVRTVLNYKRISYKTVWVSYPDIEPTLKSIGGSPTGTNPEGEPYYTLPAILDTSGNTPVVITDSLSIAEYLDTNYPERPVFPKKGKALECAFEKVFNHIVGSRCWRILLPLAWRILDEHSQVYFRETRERWYGDGKTLEEWLPEGPVREKEWTLLKQGFDNLAAILDKNGPDVTYAAGDAEPTRADMIIVSYLAWIKASTPEDWQNRVRHWSGGRWERLWNNSEAWRVVQ